MLVITCEGNCGFYETGIISTPMSKGYSILGWNHPGFGSSTVSITFVLNFMTFYVDTLMRRIAVTLLYLILNRKDEILAMLQLISIMYVN